MPETMSPVQEGSDQFKSPESKGDEAIEVILAELRPDYVIAPVPIEDVHPLDRHIVKFTAVCPEINGFHNITAHGSTEDEAVFGLERKLRKLLAN